MVILTGLAQRATRHAFAGIIIFAAFAPTECFELAVYALASRGVARNRGAFALGIASLPVPRPPVCVLANAGAILGVVTATALAGGLFVAIGPVAATGFSQPDLHRKAPWHKTLQASILLIVCAAQENNRQFEKSLCGTLPEGPLIGTLPTGTIIVFAARKKALRIENVWHQSPFPTHPQLGLGEVPLDLPS